MASSDIVVHMRLGTEDVTSLLAWMQTAETLLSVLVDRLAVGWDKDQARKMLAELASLRTTSATVKEDSH